MIKGLSSPQGKRMVSPKDLKPKIHEKALGRRKERPSLPRSEDQRESSGKNSAMILRGCQGLGILDACSTAEIGLRQFKRSTKKTQEMKDKCVLLKHPLTQLGTRGLGVPIHEQGGWHLRESRMKNYKVLKPPPFTITIYRNIKTSYFSV